MSVGGNDIVLNPSKKTIICLLWLTKMSFESSIKNGSAWGLSHLKKIFKDEIEDYIKKIITKNN